MTSRKFIYHVCSAADWARATASGTYEGSTDDARDGYLHFSTATQVRESVAKHRAGQEGLVMLAVNPDGLGNALRWEPSRGGALFPHLYGPLAVAAVAQVIPLPLGADRLHVFPDGVA